jgi:hypothetical protein
MLSRSDRAIGERTALRPQTNSTDEILSDGTC